MRRIFIIACCFFLALLPLVAAEPSGTLPVMYIHADDSISSKTDYVSATVYIDASGTDGIESLGTAEEPEPLLIRGRGNWTWFGSFEKKSYKLKFISDSQPLGMAANKHFALLAHADGYIESFFRNTAGFKLAELLGLSFTPKQQPVELVLNDEYMGLYFLTETVRVDVNRVNITKQRSNETADSLITGGWLVEIDNGLEDNQIKANVLNTPLPYWLITYHSPEVLSIKQHSYLRNQMNSILRAVYDKDKSSTEWEELIDVDVLARYYLAEEMLDNVEAFLGSCYMYKDLGETTWKFGPLWDLGHAFNTWHEKNRFIYDYDGDWEPCIMEEIARFPRFQDYIRRLWIENYEYLYEELEAYLTAFSEQIAQAVVCDRARWPFYGTPDASRSLTHCLQLLNEKRAFLTGEWGGFFNVVRQGNHITPQQGADSYTLQGLPVRSCVRGIYIEKGKKFIKR